MGAFDKFGKRADLLKQFYVSRKDKVYEIPDFSSNAVMFDIENTLIGDCITFDPFEEYRDFLEQECIHTEEDIKALVKGSECTIGGRLTEVKERLTKTGKKMAFIKVTFDGDIIDAAVFPDDWRSLKNYLVEGYPVICEAFKTNSSNKIAVNEVLRLDWQ